MKFICLFIYLQALHCTCISSKIKRDNDEQGKMSNKQQNVGSAAIDQDTVNAMILNTENGQIIAQKIASSPKPPAEINEEHRESTSIEQGFKNETYSERFVYIKHGSDGNFPCFENIQFNSTLRSLEFKWTDTKNLNLAKREQIRITVNERQQLSITDAQSEDSGKYFCTLTAVTSAASTIYYTNVVHLNVYSSPDLALEFPFIFEALNCNDKLSKVKLEEIKGYLCKETCVYEFRNKCSSEPWFRKLESLKSTVSLMSSTPEVKFFPDETLGRRKLTYICGAGFALYKETCVPCFPGKFSSHRGNNNCTECPRNYYQDNPGTKQCVPCPSGKITDDTGNDNVKECHAINRSYFKFTLYFFILSGLIFGVLAIILILLLVKCKDQLKKMTSNQLKDEKKPLQPAVRKRKKNVDLLGSPVILYRNKMANKDDNSKQLQRNASERKNTVYENKQDQHSVKPALNESLNQQNSASNGVPPQTSGRKN